jgi:fused signal recognition particle receptor
MSVFDRIRESLTRTKQQIVDRFDEIVRRADEPERRSRPVDVDTIDALEELLISADIGVAATDRIISAVKARSRSGESLRDLVKQQIRAVFDSVDQPITVASRPQDTLIVGETEQGRRPRSGSSRIC